MALGVREKDVAVNGMVKEEEEEEDMGVAMVEW